MKTLMIFTLAAGLAFTACQNDAEFASPTSLNDASMTALSDVTLTGPADPLGPTTCLGVLTNHTMQGTGKLLSTSFASFPKRGTYSIRAQGAVLSDPLGEGDSEIRFTYNQATGQVLGQLLVKFSSGNAIELTLDGIAQQTSLGQTISLKMHVSNADLMMDPEVMKLTDGTLVMVLPSKPIGAIEMSLMTKGTYCEQ